MTAIVVQGKAQHLPLPDASVDLIVTSPPYFALRSYQDGGEHYAGQIGSEASPQEFLEALWTCTREWMRVLKPSGSLFVNLGDKYSGAQARSNWSTATLEGGRGRLPELSDCQSTAPTVEFGGVPSKSLMGIPWRYAIGCIDQLGLILRAEIVWAKPNGLPESVTDRVRRSHENWFHFTLQPRYFSAVDEIREPHVAPDRGAGRGWLAAPKAGQVLGRKADPHGGLGDRDVNPLGKLPGSVWEINENESLVRHILEAVKADGVTIDEAERLISGVRECAGLSVSGNGSTGQASAGSGSAAAIVTGMESTTSPTLETAGHTDSPTRSQSGLSLKGSRSTISAETPDAFDPNTLSRSQSLKTTLEGISALSRNAKTGTLSAETISTSERTDSGSAEPVYDSAPATTAPGSVWNIPSEPLTVPAHLGVDHFAAFPTAWPKRLILGWSPSGICTACGEPRRPVADRERFPLQAVHRGHTTAVPDAPDGRSSIPHGSTTTITGYACACPDPSAPTRPSVILDPFGGTGTTAAVASALGRIGISVDLSHDYSRLAQWRTTDPATRAKIRGERPPVKQMDGQLGIFDGLEVAG